MNYSNSSNNNNIEIKDDHYFLIYIFSFIGLFLFFKYFDKINCNRTFIFDNYNGDNEVSKEPDYSDEESEIDFEMKIPPDYESDEEITIRPRSN